MSASQARAETTPRDQRLSRRLKRWLGWTLLCGLISALGALLFLAWLANEVLKGDTRQFDEAARALVHQHASPPLTALMRSVTVLGTPTLLLMVSGAVIILFLMLRWRRAAVLLGTSLAGAALLNLTLKLSFQRARPTPFFATPLPHSFSFPSGHALWSFCFYGVLAAIITARIRRRLVRFLIWAVAVLLISLIGLSRVYLGVHYPSDVLAGYAAALIWVVVVALGDRLFQRRRVAPPHEPAPESQEQLKEAGA